MVEWKVVSVTQRGDLILDVSFAGGLTGAVRFLPSALSGVFEQLRDPAVFRQVSVEHGAVTWPGDVDLAPDAMYDEIKARGECVFL